MHTLPLMGEQLRGRKRPTHTVSMLYYKRFAFVTEAELELLEGPLKDAFPNPLEVNRKRFPPVGSRSADLVAGLSSPLLCAPAWWPAHLLGCSTWPRPAACLAATSASCCLGAPLDSPAPTQVLVVRPI
jgi:hypothetical protein